MMTAHKLNIFTLLSHINKKDIQYYKQLSSEEKKGFAPVVVMRWLTGSNNPLQIIYVNELLNLNVFHLYKHPELLYQLMTITAVTSSQRLKWIKKKSTSTKTQSLEVLKQYYNISTKIARQYLSLVDNETLLLMADELGYQKEKMTKLKAELRRT